MEQVNVKVGDILVNKDKTMEFRVICTDRVDSTIPIVALYKYTSWPISREGVAFITERLVSSLYGQLYPKPKVHVLWQVDGINHGTQDWFRVRGAAVERSKVHSNVVGLIRREWEEGKAPRYYHEEV